MPPSRRLSPSRLLAVAAAASLAVLGSAATGVAASSATGPVSTAPAAGTPHLVDTGTTEQIRQIVQCGSTMYAVGTFTEVATGKKDFTRNGAFSFSANAPYKVTTWDPEVNGTVNSIAFNGGNCANAYIGGKFTSIGGTAARDIAEVSTSTGAVVPTFHSTANAVVQTVAAASGHLLVGGSFTSINGSAADPYFASLSPTTGRNDGYAALAISGHYSYSDAGGNAVAANPTRVYNQQVSNDGSRDLIEGDFTSVGGQPRRQIAMLDLGTASATTDAWYANEFDANCSTVEPFYARAAAWSPDDSTVYVATTGYKPASGPGYLTSDPRAGLCDAAVAFPSTAAQVTHKWINYTGCDSLFAAAADTTTAYFAGHERWASNPSGCDGAGAGAVPAAGMVGLSAADGSVAVNPTRSRGLGADDMLTTSAGLWIASDNLAGSAECGNVYGHAGICLLPYTG